MEGLQARAEIHARCTELSAIDLRSSHQFEEEIGAASSENLVLIHKTEFSIRTPSYYSICLASASRLFNDELLSSFSGITWSSSSLNTCPSSTSQKNRLSVDGESIEDTIGNHAHLPKQWGRTTVGKFDLCLNRWVNGRVQRRHARGGSLLKG